MIEVGSGYQIPAQSTVISITLVCDDRHRLRQEFHSSLKVGVPYFLHAHSVLFTSAQISAINSVSAFSTNGNETVHGFLYI